LVISSIEWPLALSPTSPLNPNSQPRFFSKPTISQQSLRRGRDDPTSSSEVAFTSLSFERKKAICFASYTNLSGPIIPCLGDSISTLLVGVWFLVKGLPLFFLRIEHGRNDDLGGGNLI